MTDGFDADTLALLEVTEEVTIETRTADSRVRRTIIWVMVDGTDVYLRSVRGDEGRWYRELVANHEGVLDVVGRRIAVRAAPAADQQSIEACNRALHRKYTGIPGFEPMLREHTLRTTLRLSPR